MFEPGEFNPLIYWVHVVLGFGSALFVVVALASRKGSLLHRRAGQFFAVSMGAAALSALYFFAAGPPAPPVLISATASIYGIGMAIMSLKDRKGIWRAMQAILAIVSILIGLLYVAFVAFAVMVPEIPIYLALLGPAAGILFLAMGWQDIGFLRAQAPTSNRRLKRHALRMALVAAEVVRAPAVSFGPQFLGDATFDFYSFGPFLLIPLIYFLALPDWIKQPAAKNQPA